MTAKKKNLLAYGLGITLAMTSMPVHAQYYGVDDSVQVDLSVLDNKPVARSLFPSVQLTPPPVAEVAPIAPVPNAVPLFSSPDTNTAYSNSAAPRDASERTAARAVGSTNIWTYNDGVFEKVKTRRDTETVTYNNSSERILKPSSAPGTLPAVHTTDIEYDSSDISLEPIYPLPTGYTKNIFKPAAASTAHTSDTAVQKQAIQPIASGRSFPAEPVHYSAPVSKQISTIDRSISALTAKEPSFNKKSASESRSSKKKEAPVASPIAESIVATNVAEIQAVTPAPAENAPTAVDASALTPAADINGTTSVLFSGTSTDLTDAHRAQISAVATSLKASGNTSHVTINGYASGDTAQKTSVARAVKVRSFLLEAGMDPLRVTLNPAGRAENEPYDRVDLVIAQN